MLEVKFGDDPNTEVNQMIDLTLVVETVICF